MDINERNFVKMKKLDILKKAVVAVAVVAMGVCAVPVMAVDCVGMDCVGVGANQAKTEDSADSLDVTITGVINVILYVLGALAVAFIIYGGIKYTMSGGDSAKVKSAKDTIMYAVVGLIVAILAYAIVNFVIGSVVGNG